MGTYSVRCRDSACRHRRVLKRHPDTYVVVPKCAICGQRKGWRIEGRAYNKRGLCCCSGPEMCKGQYFPHKPTHPLCEKHPRGEYNQLKRRGVNDDDMPLDLLGESMKEADECPF